MRISHKLIGGKIHWKNYEIGVKSKNVMEINHDKMEQEKVIERMREGRKKSRIES